jgi:hypothetical protein
MSIYERELRRFHKSLTTPAWVSWAKLAILIFLTGMFISLAVIWWVVIYWTFKVNPVWGLILVAFTMITGAINQSRK